MGSPIGKAFNARLPEALHRAVKKVASAEAAKAGGQTNMNKVMVASLFHTFRSELSTEEIIDIEKFIERL